MELVVVHNLSNLSYVLSGKKAFFYRYCDTGFKNKWTGLWAMPYKYLEYFVFKVNGEWLSPETITGFSHGYTHSEHEFKLRELKAKEFLFVPEERKAIVCKLTLENPNVESKNTSIELETAINIREREENWHDRKYTKNVLSDKIIVGSSKGYLVFGSLPKGDLVSEEFYKDHFPSGESQRCFIPGIYRINITIPQKSKEEIVVIFACGENKFEALSEFEETRKTLNHCLEEKERVYALISSNSKFKSGISNLDKLFQSCVIATEKLGFHSKFGFGYFAGFPWFTQFWGRDLGWMVPGIVDYGNFEKGREALNTLAQFQSENGSIPNTIYMNGRIDYNSIDSTMLWIIALNHYIMNSGDVEFLKAIQTNLDKAVKWCKSMDKDGDGFLEHGKEVGLGNDTWMDTLERGSKAVEVQAFWIEALKSAGNLYEILGNKSLSDSLKKEAIELKIKFERMFWNENENLYYDSITSSGKDETKTVNSIFPLFFGISKNSRKVLERLENEDFYTQYGLRTLSKSEKGFDPKGYHTGSVWGFVTLILACAEFANNRTERGLEILNLMSKKTLENCVGAIGEAWDSENNELIGCCLQGWSSALVIRCIDEFFLGIKLNALENSIIVSPSILEGMVIERRKRIGNDFVNLKMERRHNKIKVSYTSDKGKEYKIIVPPRV